MTHEGDCILGPVSLFLTTVQLTGLVYARALMHVSLHAAVDYCTTECTGIHAPQEENTPRSL